MPAIVMQIFNSPLVGIFAWVCIAIIALVGACMALRRVLRLRYGVESGLRRATFLVSVPKESSEKKSELERTKTLQEIQEDISVAELFFSIIGGLKAERGLKTWFLGEEEIFSFEIASHGGLISFYIDIPERFVDYVKQQLLAQYPVAQIERIDEYNIFRADGAVRAGTLKLTRPSVFPIKTYRNIESDPLNGITNALSKVAKDDGAVIQFTCKSAPKSWRTHAQSIVSDMQSGKTLSRALQSGAQKKMFAALSFVSSVLSSAVAKKPGEKTPPRALTALENEMLKGLEEKASKAGIAVNVRIVASASHEAMASQYVSNIMNAFSQYNIYQFGNAFKGVVPRSPDALVHDMIFRIFSQQDSIVLNTEEMASLFHLPLPSTETPNIRWLVARKAAPPTNLPADGVVLGFVPYRDEQVVVHMKDQDRRRHMYIIGKSGSGKTEMMKSMVRQDIEGGKGVCVIDPHGDFAQDALAFVPPERAEDVIYFSPADVERPMGLNLLEYDERYPEQKTFVVNEMLKIFDKLYDLKSTGGPMFEQYMRNAMILVMDDVESGATLLEIPRVLADEKYRAFKLSKCKTQVVIDFWTKEAQKAGGEASLANMVPYITSKLTPFITNDVVRPIIGQQKSAFNVRRVMDEGKILLLDLSKGKLGDINAYLIGMVLVGKILMAALSRTDMKSTDRKDFYLYIDEFQNFITDSISIILSEARKYGLNLVIAHQYIGQIAKGGDTAIRDAVFGNAGTMAAFRVGAEDAEFLAREFAPVFSPFDLVNCEAYTANIKLLIDNTASRPFTMSMYPPAPRNNAHVDDIRELSRLTFGRDKSLVDAEIARRMVSGS